MVDAVGTYRWALLRGGTLGTRDYSALAMQAVRQSHRIPGEIVMRTRPHRLRDVNLPKPNLQPPTSELAAEAEQLCRAHSQAPANAWLYDHSLRTYELACYLASARDIGFDREVLWIACMVHDIGLVHEDTTEMLPPCFAVRSALIARDRATAHGWSNERVDALATTVAIHINIRVDRRVSPEGYLLNAASSLDVAGIGLRSIHCADVNTVRRRRKVGFDHTIACVWASEAERHQRTRCSLLQRLLAVLIRTCPP